MIDLFNYISVKITENISGPKSKKRDKLQLRCPICGDSKKNSRKMRGWLSRYKGTVRFSCFNCGINISGLEFLSRIEHKPINEIKAEIFKKQNINFSDYFKEKITVKKEEFVEKTVIKFKKPLQWGSFENSDIASKIINTRKVLEAPFKPNNWKLYFNDKTNRIGIPWIRDGQMCYYQERSLIKNNSVKYLFPKNTKKDVSGLDEIDTEFPYLFLVEGIFDQIWVKNGVTIGGVSLSEYQEELLNDYKDFTFVYLLDNQNRDKTSRIISKKLFSNNKNVFIWPNNIKEKDVNEYVLNNKNSKIFEDENFLKKNIFKGILGCMKLNLK